MSTKVYVAYALRDNDDLWPFVRDTIRKGRVNVRREVMKLVKAKASMEDFRKTAQVLVSPEEDEAAYERGMLRSAWAAVYKGYREQCSSSLRDEYDFDVSVAIRELDGVLYMIPHADMFMRHTLDFLKKDKRIKDWAYWNNSDPPPKMTPRAWAYRGKIWDSLNDAGWENYLVVEVCNWQGFYQVVPPP